MSYETELLEHWAERWGIPTKALDELRYNILSVAEPSTRGNSEGDVAKRMLMNLSASGWRLWRNNVGAGLLSDTHGKVSGYIRFGLANESSAMNRHVKSGDYIGIRPLLITPNMVGTIVGQFASIETKAPGWVFNPKSPHEVAQERWITLVKLLGGFATFHTEPKIK